MEKTSTETWVGHWDGYNDDELDIHQFLEKYDLKRPNTLQDEFSLLLQASGLVVFRVERGLYDPLWTIMILRQGGFQTASHGTAMRLRRIFANGGYNLAYDTLTLRPVANRMAIHFLFEGGSPGLGISFGLLRRTGEFVPKREEYTLPF